MSRGYRLFFVAAFGWLALGTAAPSNNSARANHAETAHNVENSLARTANSQAQVVEQARPGEYEKPCEEGERNYRSDLCAQWEAARAARDAADSAWWAVFWSIFSLGLSGAGLVALLVTIKQGREALAKAEKANGIAQDTAKRQLRAYVTFSKLIFIPVFDRDTKLLTRLKVQGRFENNGQTPAKIVACITGGQWFPANEDPGDFYRQFRESDAIEVVISVGQMSDFGDFTTLNLNAVKLREIYTKHTRAILSFKIKYLDVFEEIWEASHASELVVYDDPAHMVRPDPNGIDNFNTLNFGARILQGAFT